MAENNGKVDEFYRAAISAGAKDNISPRARAEYYPGYYAADVFDPDGYSFEVVHKS
jgi:predicted lactoylglutathione lyase